MNTRSICYIAALSLGMASLSIIAAEDEATKKFEYLDSDGNGFISKSEATQNIKLRQRWNDVDKDKDDQLSEKEFKKFANVPNEPYPE